MISNNSYYNTNKVKLSKKKNNCSYSNDSNISVISKILNNKNNDESINHLFD